ncbi:unnamed protein product, partial [Mesorhabditis spiculigera]
MILRSFVLISCLARITTSLKCSSYLESRRDSSIRDIRLAENRTLCLRPIGAPSMIYAISVTNVWTQWALSARQDFVLADFELKNCHCDCRRNSEVCDKGQLKKECPDCLQITNSHPNAAGCDRNVEATSCCNVEAKNLRNISTFHLSHPILFYRLEISKWSENPAEARKLLSTDVWEEMNAGERHRLPIENITFELHTVPKAHNLEREVVLDLSSQQLIPLLYSHRCVDAFTRTASGALEVRDESCLPKLALDSCPDQRLLVQKITNRKIDFTRGQRATISEDERHVLLDGNLVLTLTIDDNNNQVEALEDTAKIDEMRDVRIEVDAWSRRHFHARLTGAQGTLQFTFVTLSLNARYTVQYVVPTALANSESHWVSVALPASIREDSTVCVAPLGQPNHQLCAHAAYKETKATSWDFLPPSVFVGSCENCVGATSIVDRIAGAVGLLVPAKSLAKLFHGEPLQWTDLQALLLSALLLACGILICVLFKRIVVPLIDCLLCCLSPTGLFSRQGDRARKKHRYAAVSPLQTSQV